MKKKKFTSLIGGSSYTEPISPYKIIYNVPECREWIKTYGIEIAIKEMQIAIENQLPLILNDSDLEAII